MYAFANRTLQATHDDNKAKESDAERYAPDRLDAHLSVTPETQFSNSWGSPAKLSKNERKTMPTTDFGRPPP